ncbi:MAG TPA: hypothetical protein VGJ48_20745, partial [Pyrinomonadaceae bacterium]
IAASTNQILHRTLQLEERKLPGGELIARSRIEIWQGKGVAARRLYDAQNKLVAGEWTRNDGSRVLYHHGSKLTFQSPKDAQTRSSLASDEIWKITPSAKDFESFVAGSETARVDERSAAYVVSYDATQMAVAGNQATLVHASLVLGRNDLHATEQTLVVREGSEEREFRFTEIGYERRAPQTVAPAIFEPDPELLSSAKPETRNSKLETNLPILVSPLPPVASASLEVEVLRLLGSISADMGQEVSVKREADGALHVEAIVETEKRKAEILSALSSVLHEGTVRVRIETNAEAQARIQRERRRAQSGSGSTDVDLQGITTSNLIPVDAEVRRYLRARGVSEQQVDGEISRLSNRVLNRSHQALLHAFAMKSLVQRFSADDLRSLDADARAKWLALIVMHAGGFQRDLASIRQELAPIFGIGAGSGDGIMEVTDEASLFRAVSRLTELASASNESIQSAFTISSANKSVTVRTPQFWRSLAAAETLATKIRAASQNR